MKRIMVAVGALLLGAGAVMAQQEVAVQQQNLMKAQGRSMYGVLLKMVKGETPYDQVTIDSALAQFEDTAKKLPALFPDSAKGLKPDGDFSASPKVWDDKAGFAAKIASFAAAVSDAKAKIKDADTLKANFPAVGKECGGCHEAFRLKNS